MIYDIKLKRYVCTVEDIIKFLKQYDGGLPVFFYTSPTKKGKTLLNDHLSEDGKCVRIDLE